MGPEGEQIKAIGARTGCSVVVEAKPRNAAFVPFRLVNYLADTPGQVRRRVAEWRGAPAVARRGGAGGGGMAPAAMLRVLTQPPLPNRRAGGGRCR